MKTFALIFLLALGAATAEGGGATVNFFFGDFTGAAQPLRKFGLYPVPNQVPATNNLGLVTGDYVAGVSDTNGSAVVTNVLAGTYRLEFRGTTITTTNYFLFPATTNTLNARDWVTLYPTGLGLLLYEEAGVVGGRILFEP